MHNPYANDVIPLPPMSSDYNVSDMMMKVEATFTANHKSLTVRFWPGGNIMLENVMMEETDKKIFGLEYLSDGKGWSRKLLVVTREDFSSMHYKQVTLGDYSSIKVIH